MPDETKKEAEKKEFTPFGARSEQTVPAAEFVKKAEGKTVTMTFPRRVVLLTDNHERIEFQPGPQEVPAQFADHWYLKDHGVKRYDPKKSAKEPDEEEETESEESGEQEPDEDVNVHPRQVSPQQRRAKKG